jgi:hypothetical protein
MPTYSVIAEVRETRVYTVNAANSAEARDVLLDEFQLMQFDVLEEEVDTMEVEEIA